MKALTTSNRVPWSSTALSAAPSGAAAVRIGGLLSIIACMAMLGTGCSSFHREWRAGGKRPEATGKITGRWEGTWRSEANGHHGRLRCLISQAPKGDCQAWFYANYLRILHFSYKVNLAITTNADEFHFEGQADLGKLAGGLYHYEGHATGDRFLSSYKCERDHGQFEMSRPVK